MAIFKKVEKAMGLGNGGQSAVAIVFSHLQRPIASVNSARMNRSLALNEVREGIVAGLLDRPVETDFGALAHGF